MLDHSRQMPASDDEGIVIPDVSNGLIDRSIYSDPQLYRLELQRIFARAWNFMCHETQIPDAGDYFINYIGEDQVIVVRGEDGQIRVLLNTCRHRGNALCRAELGNTKAFVCSYHGWTYGLDGKLIGIPGKTDFYRDAVDQAQWGLAPAAKVEHYKGFYFATLDPAAPSLFDYLGDVGRVGIESMLNEGDVVALDGVQKNVIDCNWKIAVDNLFDWYHVKVSHNSASRVGFLNQRMMMPMTQMVMLGEFGHAIGGPMVTPEQQAKLDALSDEERAAIDRLPDAERAKVTPTERRPLRSTATKAAMGPIGVRATGHPQHLSQSLDLDSRHAAQPPPAARPRPHRDLVVHGDAEGFSMTPSGVRPRNSSATRSDPPVSSNRTTGKTGADNGGDSRRGQPALSTKPPDGHGAGRGAGRSLRAEADRNPCQRARPALDLQVLVGMDEGARLARNCWQHALPLQPDGSKPCHRRCG